MGSSYLFSCPSCGYEAEVSGGLDFGMACVTHTVSCPDCKKLSDALISTNPGDVVAPRLLIDDEEGDLDVLPGTVPEQLRCETDRRHTARPWEHPGPCPRCGATLVKGELAVDWD